MKAGLNIASALFVGTLVVLAGVHRWDRSEGDGVACERPVGLRVGGSQYVQCWDHAPITVDAMLRRAGVLCPKSALLDVDVSVGGQVTVVNNKCAVRIRQLPAAQKLVLGLPVELNSATLADFEALPRIGPVIARRMMAYRKNVGCWKSTAQLANVKGIGERTVARLRELVVVGVCGHSYGQ